MEFWMEHAGTCDETTLADVVAPFRDASYTALAWFTDRFQGVRGDALDALTASADTLLELRVFRDERELWVHRSCIGDAFQWRIADDNILEENVNRLPEAPFFREKDSYRIRSFQMLDIKEAKRTESGLCQILTTVGGRYALPMDERSRFIEVVSYLRYAPDGVANVADYRLAGFSDKGGVT